LRAGDAAAARRCFDAALQHEGRSPGAVEGLGRAAYLDLEFALAIELWERAYGEYREAGDNLGAGRMARTLAPMYGTIAGSEDRMGVETIHHLSGGEGQRAGGCPDQA
jgi:hypothetical protein